MLEINLHPDSDRQKALQNTSGVPDPSSQVEEGSTPLLRRRNPLLGASEMLHEVADELAEQAGDPDPDTLQEIAGQVGRIELFLIVQLQHEEGVNLTTMPKVRR